MSYRDPRQALEPGIGKILEGIDILSSAISERIRSDDGWKDSHIEEISQMKKRLSDLQVDLELMQRSNW